MRMSPFLLRGVCFILPSLLRRRVSFLTPNSELQTPNWFKPHPAIRNPKLRYQELKLILGLAEIIDAIMLISNRVLPEEPRRQASGAETATKER